MREVGVNDQGFGMAEIPFYGDFALGFTVTVELMEVQRAEQKWIEIDVLDGNLAVQRKGIGET